MAAARLWISLLTATVLCYGLCVSENAPNYSFMKEATAAPRSSTYDYIVIGGGTAGCPLAATLSQNATVLLLERGGSPYGNPNITNLGAFGAALADLSPNSPSQRFVSEDGVANARARVLGGGSCLNAGFYTRAAPYYVRQVGWDGRLVNESYAWVEEKVAFRPPMRQWQTAVRDALLEAGVEPFNGFTYDHVYGTKIGGSIFDREGRRHTAADLLEYADPAGVTVLLHATVHRIFFSSKDNGRRRANGVAFKDASGGEHRAYLKRGSKNEIVVSAGALGSPQLLMLSGVGPAAQLRAHNIPLVLDMPMVGQYMADNPMNAIYVPSPVPVEVSLIQVVGITRFGSYIEAASGESFTGSSAPRRFGLFVSQNALVSINTTMDAPLRGGYLLEKIMGPVSTGHLALRSRNPDDNPSVTFNYFKSPEDLRRCVQGIRTIEKLIQSKAFSPFKFNYLTVPLLINMTLRFPVNDLPKHDNASTSLEQFCRDTVMTIWHYHGGCLVGKVVDRDYKVLGVDALRVIDGSTFNYSPGTNPQATVMMLGRYMGVKMLSERLA
uniref:Glucose-methanol-choline oxidoreductase N-terminal domain-containing protein n=1 Tax=Kalanchoe fedtschenkoi TaxID=63787 RepID=A0A7N0V5W9_KALFE